jgi:hypothetical protein
LQLIKSGNAIAAIEARFKNSRRFSFFLFIFFPHHWI